MSPCFPPLKILKHGVGILKLLGEKLYFVAIYLNNSIFFDFAEALAQARETESMELAPKFFCCLYCQVRSLFGQ